MSTNTPQLYPEQLTDISYGAGGAIEIDDSFVGEGAGAAILVPEDGSLGTTWTGGQPFDDGTWQNGAIGVGYETGAQGSAHLLSATNHNSRDGNDVYQLSSGDLSDGSTRSTLTDPTIHKSPVGASGSRLHLDGQ